MWNVYNDTTMAKLIDFQKIFIIYHKVLGCACNALPIQALIQTSISVGVSFSQLTVIFCMCLMYNLYSVARVQSEQKNKKISFGGCIKVL